MNLHSLFTKTIELLFPIVCVACKKGGAYICTPCMEKIPRLKTHPLSHKNIFAVYSYQNDAVRKLIFLLKYKYVRTIASVYAESIENLIHEHVGEAEKITLVPIPTTKSRIRIRGFNQAKALCDALCKKNKNKFSITDCLIRKREAAPQTTLKTRLKRIQNMKDTFAINSEYIKLLLNKTIVVIDDVTTTGATLENALAALENVHPAKLFACALAYQPFKTSSFEFN